MAADSLIVIEQGRQTDATDPERLRDASLRERARRTAVTPVAVITNKNLKESGEGGQITIGAAPPPLAPQQQAAVKAALEEEYWRSRALELRLNWRAAVDLVMELEQDVATLRRRFYAEDDPFFRDNEIKPAWDRSLEELSRARYDGDQYGDELDRLLDEGRQSGALPGWLREGVEYEPEPLEDDDNRRRRDDPNEPEIVDEDNWIEP